jgi:hypothetical protein
MSHTNSDTYKAKGYDNYNDNIHYYADDGQCSPLWMIPAAAATTATIYGSDNNNEMTRTSNNEWDYPGNRRGSVPVVPSSCSSSSTGTVLVRTAGNALQAVPATFLQQQVFEEVEAAAAAAAATEAPLLLIQVTVPPNAQAGDTIHVRSPYSNEEMLIAATIPPGLVPGQTFHVTCPTAVAVPEHDDDDATKHSRGDWWCQW